MFKAFFYYTYLYDSPLVNKTILLLAFGILI